jgi:uncharacterized protein (DUF1778 family)
MPTSTVISVRVSNSERELLDEAAGKARTNLSDYVRRQAIDAAEISLMNRSTIAISEDTLLCLNLHGNNPSQTAATGR